LRQCGCGANIQWRQLGATGDGGHFDELAELLADEFTVVSYDRRGNGRSPVPPGWTTTSPEEQADDAAALLDALGTGPASVFGTSAGGIFALCLLIRHPELVRGAILHEPGLYALVDDFDAMRAPLRALVQDAMATGGRLRRWSGSGATWRAMTAGIGSHLRSVNACVPPRAR
jgi:pimeloyl-ACP methyl ester carboxylesterase